MTLFDALPATIRIGPYDVRFQIEDYDWSQVNDAFGQYDRSAMRIHLAANAAPTEQHALDTLLHEVIHAIWHIYGVRSRDSEERIVSAHSTAWTQIYRDNPWLCDLIRGAVS